MFRLKLFVIVVFGSLAMAACIDSKPKRYTIAESKSYEASLFKQNCAICHGPEADGKTQDDGTVVPSLREGSFKFKSEGEIYDQIANGGNGMVPHRYQLTERELKMLTKFVLKDLRNQ